MDTPLPAEARAPQDGPLVDRFGRIADDLRVSVTDRCNFRCTYCMPAEGLDWLPKAELLTFEELTRVLAVFVDLGVRSIKVTGGEPTVRADLPTLVRMFREAAPGLDISMTTNGLLLDTLAPRLADAGLDRVTVSLDSLVRHRFQEMTRRDALDRVLAGIRAAVRAGLTPIKINCVVIGGQNDDEVVEFARWSRETGHIVRFIEYMPPDAQREWSVRVPRGSARAIDEVFPSEGDHEPATSYTSADGAPGIGISSAPAFCDDCNRLRSLPRRDRACLFALTETDLRGPLRAGASDEALAALIRDNVWSKWSGHRINLPDFTRPDRSMSAIGG
jgi:cyclic pyranopterin phosphate synthase